MSHIEGVYSKEQRHGRSRIVVTTMGMGIAVLVAILQTVH